ncbi:hypothetical protein NliqN6_5550 [Naganishia liquefaciens]|uniref:Major facilitator superfamily (MFS) profile domain-containing protein n=1 Tax=Naganishia liquefaciens TaxID=104408 RepID=A0A8H3TYG5_9TREE|nr:hypothetical protein NliqN6_5550 [Naganishia liquefaciens]
MAYLDCNQTNGIPRRASRRKSVHRDAENSRAALSTASRVSEDKASDAAEVKDHKYSGEEIRARRFSSTSAARPTDEQEPSTLSFVPFDVEDAEPPEYLDGGFGWVIVASTFVIAFHFLGYLYGWGVIQAHLLGKGLATSQLLSVIGGLQAFFNAAGCMPAEWLVRKIGLRKTAVLGVTLNSLAVLLASFCTHSLGGLIFLQGIVAGIACAILFMVVYPLPAQWFLRKRGIATGITSCGGGIGGAAWSLIIQKLIDRFGLPWAYRFMALSLMVFGIPAALVLKQGVRPRPPIQGIPATKEPSIYKSANFVRLLIACFIVSYPFFIPAFFIPQYTISLGYSSSTGALFGAIYNVASGVGRIGFGVFADVLVGNLTSWTVALFAVAISSLCVWPFAYAKGVIAIFVVLAGMGSGGYFSLQSSIVAQIVGSHRVGPAIGAIELVSSIGFLAGPVSGGALLDAFGGPDAGAKAYKPAMYLVGGTTFVSVVLAIWIRISYSKKLFVKA